MKANRDDSTNYQQNHDEYWLLEDGIYYLFNEGHWQRGRPDFNGLGGVSYDRTRNQG